MSRLAVTIGRFVQTAKPPVAVLRDGFLTALEMTGAASWMRERIKPIPAYCEGAFATTPHRLPFRRSVGSQFPQPLVMSQDGSRRLLDEVLGAGWSAISAEGGAAAGLARAGLRTLCLDRDVVDPEGVIGGWLAAHGVNWVVLRPDRFVFACGSDAEAAAAAMDERHRWLGRAA
jgi:3-(3-hydroxy-phenyl)propionate hydroxylase